MLRPSMRNGDVLGRRGVDAASCGVCRATSDALIDLLGTAICQRCLRRIDADPREKRQLMFVSSAAAYS